MIKKVPAKASTNSNAIHPKNRNAQLLAKQKGDLIQKKSGFQKAVENVKQKKGKTSGFQSAKNKAFNKFEKE